MIAFKMTVKTGIRIDILIFFISCFENLLTHRGFVNGIFHFVGKY